jgi:hypothetical protein
MARIVDRRKAIKLRKQGKTYTFIKGRLGVSKSTLSYWIKDVELTLAQREKINKDTKAKRIETYITTVKERRKRIFENYCNVARQELLPFSTRDFLMAGLFLYLGEGSKSDWSQVCISNSDPSIIKFATAWLTKILGVNKKDIRVAVHLYRDMDMEQELNFWQQVMGVSRKQFWKPYIKKTSSQKIDHATFGHGTCKISYGSAKLKKEIMAKIKVILEEATKLPKFPRGV